MYKPLPIKRKKRLLILSMALWCCFNLAFASSRVASQDLTKIISLDLERKTLKEAFDQIAEKAKIAIIYSNINEVTKKEVTMHVKKKALYQILNDLLPPYKLSYQVIDDKIVIVQTGVRLNPSKDDNRQSPVNQIKGKVTDSNGVALHGATVKLKEGSTITITDQNGDFEINSPETTGTLIISFVGYKPIEVNFSQTETGPFKIVLIENQSTLREVSVVSTGYQTLPKERATGSFAQINNPLLNRRVSTDILSRLEGIVPGLLFNRNTLNSSNGVADISIRGVSTINAQKQPLIVLDGFPYDGDINNINPNSIESISILKDAAAASIWGVKSGNGVIVITSKHGLRNQKTLIEFNSNVTVGEKLNLKYNSNFLNSNDFINYEQALFSKGYYDDDLSTGYVAVSPAVAILDKQRSGLISSSEAANQLNTLRNIDVRNDLSKYFYQPSVNQQYSLNLKGGSTNSDYFFSVGYDNNKSNEVGNLNDRLAISSNYNFYPVKNLTISAGVNYVQTSATANSPLANINGGNTKSGLYPYAQLVDSKSNSLSIVKDYASSFVDTAGNGRYYDWKYRPLDELHNADNKSTSTDNRINFGIKYDFLKGFSAELKYQYERQHISGNNYLSDQTYYTGDLINQFTQGYPSTTLTYPIPQGGILQQSSNDLYSNHGRFQLNYSKKFNSNNELNVIAGAEISSAVTQSNSNTAYGYSKENSTTSNIDAVTYFPTYPSTYDSQIPNSLGFGKFTDHYLSYFSNAAYTYKERYVISASGRIDQSNLFGVNTNQKGVPLYSTGLAWLFSKESFFHSSWLDYGKLRATYGYNGNVDKTVAAFTTQKQIGGNGNYYYGIPFLIVDKPGNPDLRWEKIRNINLGLDFSTKNGLVSGYVEIYFKKGADLIGDTQLPPTTGFIKYRGNYADIKGSGIDVALNSENIRSDNFKWVTNFLFSKESNIVTKYNVQQTVNTCFLSGSGNGTNVIPLQGRPLYAIYSYRWAGLSHDTGDPQGYLNGIVSKDYNAIINTTTPNNFKYDGPSRPTIYGSLRNNFTYHAISLSFNLIYKFNYYFRKPSIDYGALAQSWFGNSDFITRWQKPGDEITNNVPSTAYPPFDTQRQTFYSYSTALVAKGDHIRLQDITLSYTLDNLSSKKLPFRKLQIYYYINNVAILWRANHSHLDPNLYANGSYEVLPIPRTYAIGLKANF
ncbi:SusC/RagA family TonB-linked outer membrane protein [Mucilaginibacter flavidus]|uniref:SusC/RagA family TonB-linked outer membrane protein n=1 Tax=Mucilaginibacter flavidus TaxID=2949309 RepID=UPI00209367BC|nr:SusC/RagA family TonB-linked outer membrane protein [Mucilaginibacter flavidus]MCO5946730.1 SusC/RagA family TonB-linked outer membrane protein [Mucilaginibacter flavidus]